MKKGTTYILICLTVVMSLIGLLIWYNVTKTAGEKNPLDADVTLNGNTTKELSVDFKDLKPGSDGQYVINLNAKNARDYSVVLKFRGDGQIKDFIDVEVTTDAEGFEGKKSKLADLRRRNGPRKRRNQNYRQILHARRRRKRSSGRGSNVFYRACRFALTGRKNSGGKRRKTKQPTNG